MVLSEACRVNEVNEVYCARFRKMDVKRESFDLQSFEERGDLLSTARFCCCFRRFCLCQQSGPNRFDNAVCQSSRRIHPTGKPKQENLPPVSLSKLPRRPLCAWRWRCWIRCVCPCWHRLASFGSWLVRALSGFLLQFPSKVEQKGSATHP